MANKIISSSNQGLGYIGTFLSQAVNDVNFQSIQSIFADTSNPNNWTATEIQSAIDLIASTATFLNGTSDVGFIPDAKNFLVGTVYNSLITRLQQLKGEIITIHDPLLKYTLNARVRGSTNSKMYKSLVNNNQGNAPESSPTNWLLLEPDVTQYFKQQIILSNNTTDPNNDIDFSAGNFTFSDNTNFANLSAITKRLDANWAVGTNQGGLDTGTKTNSTWYHCYAIYNPTTLISDVIFSINAIIPTLPTGYTKYKYIGSIKTNVSGNIIPFKQRKKYFEWQDIILDVSLSSVVNVKTPILVSVPLGIETLVNIRAGVFRADLSDMIINIGSTYNNIPMPDVFTDVDISCDLNYLNTSNMLISADTSSNIAYRASVNTALSLPFIVKTRGYFNLAL